MATKGHRQNIPLRSRAEKKVLQNLQREIKIRELEDENRSHGIIAATTKWEGKLAEKDQRAMNIRQEYDRRQQLALTNISVKTERKKRLEELYKQEEKTYEAELQNMGLAYRRERY